MSRTITAPTVIAGQMSAPTILNHNTYPVASESTDKALCSTYSTLNDRLNEPFVTVNTVSGEMGIKQAQDEYERLMRNKSPKSRR